MTAFGASLLKRQEKVFWPPGAIFQLCKFKNPPLPQRGKGVCDIRKILVLNI